jgi:hypothetical protein
MNTDHDESSPTEGDRYVVALTFNHGDRLVGAKSFASLRGAVEWMSRTDALEVFGGNAWAVVDASDGRTIGCLEDLAEWSALDDLDDERALDAYKEMTLEKQQQPPTHFCGGLVLFGTWKKVKRRALVGQCEICRKPVVIRFE